MPPWDELHGQAALRLASAAHVRTYGRDQCRDLLEGAGFEAVAVERYRIDWFWGLMTAEARTPG